MNRLVVVCALGVGACAVASGCTSGSDGATSSTTAAAVTTSTEQVRGTTPARGDDTVPIEGTSLVVPVPDQAIGTDRRELVIPLVDSKDVVRGVAFYRPGPMSGSVVGGVSVVYDDSSAVQGADGNVASPAAIAENANPGVKPRVSRLRGRTVLGWPDSELVPAEGLPQEARVASRYVVLLDEGIVMVTFDDVPAESRDAYLDELAAAL